MGSWPASALHCVRAVTTTVTHNSPPASRCCKDPVSNVLDNCHKPQPLDKEVMDDSPAVIGFAPPVTKYMSAGPRSPGPSSARDVADTFCFATEVQAAQDPETQRVAMGISHAFVLN